MIAFSLWPKSSTFYEYLPLGMSVPDTISQFIFLKTSPSLCVIFLNLFSTHLYRVYPSEKEDQFFHCMQLKETDTIHVKL